MDILLTLLVIGVFGLLWHLWMPYDPVRPPMIRDQLPGRRKRFYDYSTTERLGLMPSAWPTVDEIHQTTMRVWLCPLHERVDSLLVQVPARRRRRRDALAMDRTGRRPRRLKALKAPPLWK